MLLNSSVGGNFWESLGLQGNQTSPPKGNQSWIFIGRTDAEADAPILWPPDEKNWLIWQNPDAGKDWGQKKKGMIEDEMVVYGITNLKHMNLSKLCKFWVDREDWCSAVHEISKSWIRLSNWTDLNCFMHPINKEYTSQSLHCCSVTKACPTLCNPMDYSPPGSSVHGIS